MDDETLARDVYAAALALNAALEAAQDAGLRADLAICSTQKFGLPDLRVINVTLLREVR